MAKKLGAKNINIGPTVGGSDSRTVVSIVPALRLGSIAANSPPKMACECRLSLRESCVEIATFAEQKATLGLFYSVAITWQRSKPYNPAEHVNEKTRNANGILKEKSLCEFYQ